MDENNIIFYISKDDWREECKSCLFKDFDETKMNKIDADYELINYWFGKEDINSWEIKRVNIKYKDEASTISHSVKWKDFDPRKMEIDTKGMCMAEVNIRKILESGRAPGIVEKTSRDRGSIMHKGKIDEGAVGDLLDKSLPKAETRAIERNTKTGHSFTKNDSNKVLMRRK